MVILLSALEEMLHSRMQFALLGSGALPMNRRFRIWPRAFLLKSPFALAMTKLFRIGSKQEPTFSYAVPL